MPAPTWNGPTRPPIFEATTSMDDLLWLNPVSLDQLTSFIEDPARWISELNNLVSNDPIITLRKDFTLRLQIRSRLPVAPADGMDCLIEGIVGTNVITVRPRAALAAQVPANWDAYWKEWRDHGVLRVTYHTDFNQGYGHLELTSDGDTAEVRADKIAAFLMLAADPEQTFAGEFYINMILDKVPAFVTQVQQGVSTPVQPSRAYFAHIPPDQPERLLNINFTLATNTDELQSLPTAIAHTNATVAVACDNMAGTWNGTQIVLDDVVVKDYA
jgi:hypothetical protein